MSVAVQFFTDFADQAVLEPVGVMVGIGALVSRWWRGAVVWFLVAGACFGIILLLKLALEACGRVENPWLYSPSGHTMAGTTIWAGIPALLGLGRVRSAALAIVAAVAFGWSRLALGVHTLPEVVVGGTIGVVGVVTISALAGPVPRRLRDHPWPLAVTIIIAVVLLHGLRSPLEADIQHVSHRYLARLLHCRGTAPV